VKTSEDTKPLIKNGRFYPTRFHPLSGPEFEAQKLPPVRWLIDNMILADGGLGCLIAADKVGKTALANQIAITLAAGLETHMARAVHGPTKVLLIEEEGSAAGWRDNVMKAAHGLGLIGLPDTLYLNHRDQILLSDPATLAELAMFVRAEGIQLVIASPLAQLAAFEKEDDNAEINRLAKALNAWAKETGASMLIAHHRTKGHSDDRIKTVDGFFRTARGASALMGAVDFGIGLMRYVEQTTGTMFLKLRNAPAAVHYYRWDPDTLLIDPTDRPPNSEQALADKIIGYLIDHPGSLTSDVNEYLGRKPKSSQTGVDLRQLETLKQIYHTKGGHNASLWYATAEVTAEQLGIDALATPAPEAA
jgi:hypothetical protein